jgi:plastocyanin
VTAQGIAWTPTDLTVPADTAFQIVFTNDDATILHDLDIHEGDPAGPTVFNSEPFPGVETRTLEVDPLGAGIYAYMCSIHTNMVGTLTAE